MDRWGDAQDAKVRQGFLISMGDKSWTAGTVQEAKV